jgi:phosphatidylserine decarboxylase
MLAHFNENLTGAPEWNQQARDAGNISLPFHSILRWPMATPAGMAVFTDEQVNNQFKRMFDVWSKFLVSSASCYVLTDAASGWFCSGALKAMPNFVDLYKCDPSTPHYGFKSWDDFFTRPLRDGARPVVFPDNDNVINSACESSVYRIAYNVKGVDTFWIKSQPYSINTMLNYDPLASQFVVGTIYQAFLGLTDYHRWHSPVNGRIVKIVLVPGLYYAQSPAMGLVNSEDVGGGSEGGGGNEGGGGGGGGGGDPNIGLHLNLDLDPNPPCLSQGFITTTSTRVLIFIQADNPKIGLMCLMAVGMVEVSTCEVTVTEGQKTKKGDQLGMFHFGGSSYCMLFRPSTTIASTPAASSTVTVADIDAAAAVVDDTKTGLKFWVQVDDYVHLNTAIATVL